MGPRSLRGLRSAIAGMARVIGALFDRDSMRGDMEGLVMAKVVTIVCDLHKGAGEEVAAAEHSIEIDGVRKTADLCADCFERYVAPLQTALERLGEADQPLEPGPPSDGQPRPKRSQSRKKPRSQKKSRSREAAATVDNAAVRGWATEQGIEVSSRGRLPRAVVEQYLAAH